MQPLPTRPPRSLTAPDDGIITARPRAPSQKPCLFDRTVDYVLGQLYPVCEANSVTDDDNDLEDRDYHRIQIRMIIQRLRASDTSEGARASKASKARGAPSAAETQRATRADETKHASEAPDSPFSHAQWNILTHETQIHRPVDGTVLHVTHNLVFRVLNDKHGYLWAFHRDTNKPLDCLELLALRVAIEYRRERVLRMLTELGTKHGTASVYLDGTKPLRRKAEIPCLEFNWRVRGEECVERRVKSAAAAVTATAAPNTWE